MSRPKSILIVEDEPDLRRGLRDNFELEGYQVLEAGVASTAAGYWLADSPDLVILDIKLPGKDGFQLLAEIRAAKRDTPVIILTARGEVWDRVRGFRLGCDDYVVKPFSLMELLERAAAVLRRSQPSQPEAPTTLTIGDTSLDLVLSQLVTPTGKTILSGVELNLAAYFIARPGRTISRRELLREVWGSTGETETRTVDVHIAALRKHLAGSRLGIEAVYKVGYRLVEQTPDDG